MQQQMSAASPLKARGSSPGEQSNKYLHYAIVVFLCFFCVCFLATAIREATIKHLWMDEVLAVWTARLPTAGAIRSAIYQGAEFSPPTYHLLLHFLIRFAGSSYLIFRLPSILAACVAAFCLFVFLRRYVDVAAAAFGVSFTLLGVLSGFAIEIRPYALVVACFSVAILLWDQLDTSRFYAFRICAITILLAAATALHFYAILLVPCVALMELFWSVVKRRVRISTWAGLAVAGLSIFGWIPLMRALASYNTGDTHSSDYYARPSLGALTRTYMSFFIFGKKQILFLLTAVILLAIGYRLRKIRFGAFAGPERSSMTNLYIVGFCTSAFAMIVFLFSLLVTHTYNARYCLAMVLGFAVLFSYVVDHLSALRVAIIPLLLVSSGLTVIGSGQIGFEVPSLDGFPYSGGAEMDSLAFLKTNDTYPIVIGEGLQYFQLEEAAPAALKSRLVYVTSPVDVKSPDPTNENQVKRWKRIRPDLQIVSAAVFFSQNPEFYILHTGSSTDVLTNWLLTHGLIRRIVAQSGDAWLFEATAPNKSLL